MYSITNNSRAAAVVVGAGLVLAVAFGGFAAPAQAQLNSTQVQAIISLLQSFGANAQTIANVQAALTGGPVSGGGSAGISCTFTRALTIGASGADVTCLQQALIAGGFSIPAGATGYFGVQTRSAVAAWQASRGVAPAVGYFGPISQAAWNLNVPGTPTTPGTPPSSGGLQGGAGDITVTERSSGVADEVLEGENNVRVLGFDVRADGSDVRITSVRVELEHTGSGNDRLNRYADEVCIFMGNTEVGCSDVRDFSESRDVYSRNIATDAIVRNGDTQRFFVAVSALNNIDSNNIGEDWVVGVGTIRFTDATGAIITDTTGDGVSGGDNGPLSATFTFEDLSSTGDVRLRVTADDSDVNDARTIQVSETSDTNNVEILSFNLDARGSDIELENMIFEVNSSGAGVTEIANDFRLMMGNTEVGRVIIDRDCDGGNDGFSANADTAICVRIVDLDDDDVVIDRGDEESFTLVADINDISGNFNEGDSFTSVTLDAGDIEAENENGDTVTNLSGSANAGPFTFQSSGLMVTVTSTPSPESLLNAPNDNSDNQGRYVIEFEVTAFENTAWIELDAASSTDADADNVGVAFSMETSSNVPAQSGVTTGILERISGGTVSGNYVRINDGQTAKFRLTVYHDPDATGIYRVQMNEIGFNQTGAAPANAAKVLTPEANYQSQSMQILN